MIKTPAWTTPETVGFTVVNPDQQVGIFENAFTYDPPPKLPAPTVKALSPANGPLAGNTTIYVDGSGYNSNTKLYFVSGGQEIDLNATFISSTRMMFKTPAAQVPGPVDVKAVNLDQQTGSLVDGFTYNAPPVYPAPVITSLTPSTGNKRGNYLVDLMGTGFQRDAVVKFGSTQIPLTAFISSTNVRVTAPASDITGSVDVTIINPDGKSGTLAGGFTYQEDIPAITLISPNSGPMAGGTTVYVDGRYFSPGLTGTINNINIPVTYVNSTRVMFTTPAVTTSGSVEVRLTNPSGLSAQGTFTYEAPPVPPAPKLTGVSPTFGPIRGGEYIYIDGTGFVNGAKISFNGVVYDTTFVNARRLMFRTPANASAGIVSFSIINPDGQESGTLNFEYR